MDIVKYLGWSIPINDQFVKKHLKQFPINKYQKNVVNFVEQLNLGRMLAIDIGANIGTKSLQFSKIFKNVVSFEPVTVNFKCLTENCLYEDNIKIYNVGLSNRNGTAIIQLSSEFSNHYGAFSIDKFIDRTDNAHSEKINIECLDNYNLSPDLIKVDTESHEIYVLLGALETIKRSHPVLILEHSVKTVNPIEEILIPMGYKIQYSNNKDHVWIHEGDKK